ncbi:hypothetical protein JCM19046_4084 [Bacillus sp. JCM 19046]|uniref:Cytochrome c oxidase subunit 2 n=1 Tax=Shouchella xiaoxiensis TaxID=766895 RepID=A0ABS2SSK7_9BACI|nr:cytochrome c oxidase subunit II [Shouchella xiaoxiensis]MBM7837986.1 cytochrome c oxidase subunit 2 [Shouchella xiaoxiensis]GAF12288.1 hypothetical protein JCM19045_1459 [Bacillus sp. JCM 19045]GAF19434.1 hypothetical protein JCM19046_4084 [Bacillus sp. JCM 19046]
MKKIIIQLTGIVFILFLAACGGNDEGDQQDAEQPEDFSGETLTIQAMNWHFDQEEYSVPAGETMIELQNESGNHGIIIREADSGEDVVLNRSGSTTANLEPGEYTIICSIPCGSGHSEMVATLVVT